MIDKKQLLRKQSLLSIKKDHGQFFQKYVQLLKNKFQFWRQIKPHPDCPAYMTTQKCIFLCILQKKHLKHHTTTQPIIQQLSKILRTLRPSISKSISQQKHCILNKKSSISLQSLEQIILQIITRQSFPFNSFGFEENTYVYQLFKAVCGKSQEVNFFGEIKYQSFTYSERDIRIVEKLFGEKVTLLDYNFNKSTPQDLEFTHQQTYVLRVKDKYAILYVKQPKLIDIVKESTISLDDLEKIFAKDIKPINPKEEEQGFFSKFLNSGTQQVKKPKNELFPEQIQCSKCLKKSSQFDCVKWNYEYYCGSCLQNPHLDTSPIPPSLIQKYFRQKSQSFVQFPISCPQCMGLTQLPSYNPAFKPQKYICSICEHTICIQHNICIDYCFCQCSSCHRSTINILHLNVAVCSACSLSFCRKCNMKGPNCHCVCATCGELNIQAGELNTQGQIAYPHLCKVKCHICSNAINRTKKCSCGGKLCYGCYYYRMVDPKAPKTCKGSRN